MRKFKGTQESFHAVDYAGYINIQNGEFYEDKDVLDSDSVGKEAAEANARLFVASKDLLEALMSIENDNGSIPSTIWEMRNKAINKALGE